MLKREPLNSWMATHFELDRDQMNAFYEPATICLGFDHTEHHRVNEFQSEHPTWRVSAPMTEPPLWDKCRMVAETESLGIRIPRLYKLGFPHNNCGGCCVRAGISHFVHLYRVLPERFLAWEREEIATRADFVARGIEPFTILKDRRGGEPRPLSLRALRLRIEAGEIFPRDEWGGCGCGGSSKAA